MKKTIKVSVIIPVYNAEKWIEETISNLHGQTLKEATFIFIDDCSFDRSAEIIKEWKNKDERIEYFRLPINQGAGHAQNHRQKSSLFPGKPKSA